jgi:hypothetical protein
LIHASKREDKEAMEHFGFEKGSLPLGCIVGKAVLVDVKKYCTKEEFLRDKEKHLSFRKRDKFPVYGFVLSDVRRTKLVKCKGKLGFFKIETCLTHL